MSKERIQELEMMIQRLRDVCWEDNAGIVSAKMAAVLTDAEILLEEKQDLTPADLARYNLRLLLPYLRNAQKALAAGAHPSAQYGLAVIRKDPNGKGTVGGHFDFWELTNEIALACEYDENGAKDDEEGALCDVKFGSLQAKRVKI